MAYIAEISSRIARIFCPSALRIAPAYNMTRSNAILHRAGFHAATVPDADC